MRIKKKMLQYPTTFFIHCVITNKCMDRTYTIFIKHSNYYIACVFVINFEFHWLIGCICKDAMTLDSPVDAQCVEVTACGAKAHVIKVAQCVVLNPCTCRGLERVYLKLIGTNDRQ